MLSFRKYVLETQRHHFENEIMRALEPISKSIENTDHSISFYISSFYPFIAYSRFVAFSVVKISRINGSYVLQLKPSSLLLGPLLIAIIGFAPLATLGPVSIRAAALLISVSLLVTLLATAESVLRTVLWWRRL
jgi:hypothetical protein